MLQPSSPVSETSLTLDDLQVHVYKGDKPEQILYAETATFNESEQVLELLKARVEIVEEDTLVAEITAPRALLYLEDNPVQRRHENDLVLPGETIYRTPDGITVESRQVVWDAQKEILSSNAGFVKRRETEENIVEIRGKSFQTDKTLRHWKDIGASIKIIPRKGEEQ